MKIRLCVILWLEMISKLDEVVVIVKCMLSWNRCKLVIDNFSGIDWIPKGPAPANSRLSFYTTSQLLNVRLLEY